MVRFTFFLLLFAVQGLVSAQEITQTVRGKVIEKSTSVPLTGAYVRLLGGTEPKLSVSDAEGNFRFTQVPVGRYHIEVTFVGFLPAVLPNLQVNAGKELVLQVELEERVNELGEELVITAGTAKEEANNEMAVVSARQFSIEESRRYAGSLNDVSRMAQNFAGVQGANDSRNDIVIRGNSPMGVLYRLEGVDIPNPNHFAVAGTTGGPVSMLNNNVLANSDFLTAAFPAEYGNALAGVFDLKLRNGNNEKHEFLGQVGFNGFEAMAEGPLRKESRASYLVNYRYSTLGVFKMLGIGFGTSSVPEYQDLSFKLHLPYKKGNVSFFGVGGLSSIEMLNKDLDTTNNLFAEEGEDLRFVSKIGVAGVAHTHFLNSTTYFKTVLSVTAHQMSVINDSISTANRQPVPYYRNNSTQTRQSLQFFVHKKFTARHLLKAGFFAHRNSLQLSDSLFFPEHNGFLTLSDFRGSVYLLQPYAQWQYRPSNTLTLTTGLHGQYFSFNATYAVEPRLGLRWQFTPAQALSLGYGLHSQLPPTQVYFNQVRQTNGLMERVNDDLRFTRSHHLVMGYDRRLGSQLRMKSEVYYQRLFNVPVNVNPDSYSLLNQGANFGIGFPDSLTNGGDGYNYGLELTVERFLSGGHYFLVTASLYESRFTGSDWQERSTAFNGNYTLNVLAGKEFNLGAKNAEGKRNSRSVLTSDIKFTLNGGQRYTPILLEESRAAGREIRDWDNAFSRRYSDYIRIDVRVGYKLNGKKITQEWALDFQNVMNRKNVFQQRYSTVTQQISTSYQIGFMPMALYRIEF